MGKKHNTDEWLDTSRLCLIGGILVAFVFFTPDAGHQEHKSLFAIACGTTWARIGDWASAWCSTKIILLGIGTVLAVEALGNLAIRLKYELFGMLLLCSEVIPTLLILFGVYELVKAVL